MYKPSSHSRPGQFQSPRVNINQWIQADELRVLDEQGKQVGIMSKSEALQKARELGIDVVEIAPQAKPPVVKLISFSKFKYQLQQKMQDDRKKSKISEIKELRLTPFMAQGDLDARIRKAEQFLKDGDKVRLVVKFKGREITKKEFGEAVLQKTVAALSSFSTVEIAPKLLGKLLMMQLSPLKKKAQEKPAQPSQE